jgi:hypothetical protein
VYTIFAPESKFYDYTFAKNKAALIRYAQDPQSNTFQLQNYGLGLTNKTAIPEQWHTIRIEVRESGFKVFQDRDLVMLGSDPFPIAQGSIRLGAVPDSEVCFDNVKVTALPTGTPTLTAPTTSTSTGSLDFRLASSTFQEDAEGWTIEGAGIGPSWERGGGNPGGFISGDDSFIEAADWFWVAPEKFTGDLSAAYGGTIFFDLSQNVRNKQITTTNDVILQGAMVTLFYDIDNPGREWRPYALWLHELGGWKNSEGRPATQGEMRSVLSSLKKIMIRGDFSDGGETIGLDNVMLVRRPGSGD